MINYENELKNSNNLTNEELNKLYQKILKYYKEKLFVDDSLSGYKSLILNQIELISIEQYIIMDKQLNTNCKELKLIQLLINSYDKVIKNKFSSFSRIEKIKIIEEYNIMNIYQKIIELDKACNIKDVFNNSTHSIEELSNNIRLISNLGFVDYDGEMIYPVLKLKR